LEEVLRDLPETIESGIKKMNVPGVQVAIVKDGQTVFSQAFGYANIEDNVKMTTEHILPIGSSSKAFTATAALLLSCDGKLDLDKPVRQYLPEFELQDPMATLGATTRDLLCHRTGLPRHDLMWIGWNDISREDLVRRVRHLPMSRPFRAEWQYQNHMFATVGLLIERVSGKTWEEFVKERIFAPLGIEHATFRVEEDERFASLYTEDESGVNRRNPPLLLDAIGPAGSINARAEEMAKWVAFNLNRGKVGEAQLIEEARFSELHTPYIPYKNVLPFRFDEKVAVGYGLGWFIDMYRGTKVIHHGGNVNGASAHIAFVPDLGLGFAVLTNANSSLFGEALVNEVCDRFLAVESKKDWFEAYHTKLKEAMKSMKEKAKSAFEPKVEGKLPSHELSEYVGTYSHPGYGDIVLSLEGETLRAAYHDNEFVLRHLHYDIFTFEFMEMPFSASFRTGVKGEIESLEIPFEGLTPPIRFERFTGGGSCEDR
jgi:CubicO group peptidase (beta-lactamase class C family)